MTDIITLEGITLPEGPLWLDEFSWYPVSNVQMRTLTGAFIQFDYPMTGGRPITLGGNNWWATKTTIDALIALYAAGRVMALSGLRGVDHQVIFYSSGNTTPVSAVPILKVDDPTKTQYRLTLSMVEV